MATHLIEQEVKNCHGLRMIRYALKCEDGHSFESWFQSASAYDALDAGGHLSCSVCGSSKVSKSLMAPRVTVKDAQSEPVPMLSQPDTDMEKAMAELRAKVEANADYVGPDFASQARAMHEGELPERSIWGEAKGDEARALIEDGVPVAPLPFKPRQKMQ